MKADDLQKLANDVYKGKIKTLNSTDKFQFKCTACGKCCFNNDVIIGIYDLIRLRNALKLPTQELIKRKFVNFYLGSTSGLPILTINFQQIAPDLTRCPFLAPAIHFKELVKKLKLKTKTEKLALLEQSRKDPASFLKILQKMKIEQWLCSVHKNRPIICRLYPLGRIKEMKKGDFDKFKERFILQNKDNWCPGWKQKHEYTLKSFLDESNFWQYQEGSDKSHDILNFLMISGFFAPLKVNKKDKNKPLFKRNSPVLTFAGNLLYNFDSINYFSKDQVVKRTIYDDKVGHQEFMYVLAKIRTIIGHFVKLGSKMTKPGTLQGSKLDAIKFIDLLSRKGGE
jgi:Fe-S-cluster containining protein